VDSGDVVRLGIAGALEVGVLPPLCYLAARLILREIGMSNFWRGGRVLFVWPVRVDEGLCRRQARRMLAVVRYHGHPMGLTTAELAAALRHATRVQRTVRSTTNAVSLGAGIPVVAAFGAVVWAMVAQAATYDIAVLMVTLVAVYMCGAAVALQASRQSKDWARFVADDAAAVTCRQLLLEFADFARNDGSPVYVEYLAGRLCRELGDFVSTERNFPDKERSKQLKAHVAAVQQELHALTNGVLREGAGAVPAFAGAMSVLTERLVQERWLRLLDVADVAEDPVRTETATQQEAAKRDGWIVVGGSLTAALGLGAAATLGIPLAAAVPAAVVFLLGPATLWGSKNLGWSPRDLLRTAQRSVEQPAAQPQAAQEAAPAAAPQAAPATAPGESPAQP
jgi:hypothetical protein